MSATTPNQLFLLADHLKLSLLERQRAISLNLQPTKQDASITPSLTQLQAGIDRLAAQQDDLGTANHSTSELSRIRKQYAELYAQFHGTTPPSVSTTHPNDPAPEQDFAHARSHPTKSPRNKTVRFRDNPNDEDDDDSANRAALCQDQQRYRDEPEAPDQSNLDNVQIHAYHTQVLREQDEQLETLGQSIGRQRVLGEQMGMEIDDQNALLDDVERGVDRHSNTLGGAQKRLGHISRKAKDNWNWITITTLIVILLLLIIVLK
ncbi:hypothetical protein CLAFUW4_12290 [Fulvia fulva]|uniref:t-SNARE coiled-coil homology domain-containing protein n=1 Tax=Passalora fulva TaxID=5499 RepID=A0A9Q8PEN4_PASFU|nr:uncharacterized protein CLAFUR5_11320 [Fulvia fulva]KAK4618338.1 hypothetical protein CLAFUR4_12295 [Fulvia fulva]KAK4618461.1 hypothetical protein CLAFUR0_12306 [Fulvia fulva]UJO21046.1 hypothetical protein CLAFUR5_11320 [Fulvia fulva]WPV18432.1 hypothetical protein CLAFUW4_12290 [Fulvia fulva]WPV33615.1 hypothetical protein CLAFUW7_12297 [Fulvia fulva]